MSQVIQYVAGDTLPSLDVTFTGVNVGLYQALRLNVAYPTPLTKNAVIVNGPAGQFRFDWAGGDLVPGRWPCEIETVDANGKVLTFQGITLEILDDVA